MKSTIRTRRLRRCGWPRQWRWWTSSRADLIERLADPDHVVRAAAARACAQSGTPTARQALREALTDTSIIVQEAAEESLARKGGQTQMI